MSETLDPMATEVDQQQRTEQLLAQAQEQGVDLRRPIEDGVDRDRAGRYRGSVRSERVVRSADRLGAPTSFAGIGEIVLSLTAKGLTTGEVAGHSADIYVPPSPRTRSRPWTTWHHLNRLGVKA
jgi:hypothetical protein